MPKLFVADLETELEENNISSYKEDFSLINQAIERISVLANDLSKLKDPTAEVYVSGTNMIKLK